MAENPSPVTPTNFVTPLRLLAVAAFVPSFPLCLAHGIISHDAVPAVGLVPQAISVAGAVLLHRLQRRSSNSDGSVLDSERGTENEDAGWAAVKDKATHPITVFVYDVIIAAALMTVLVFTWIKQSTVASLSMLAAYATIPLLTSFFAHLILGLQAIYEGLAIRGLTQWLAWRTVPGDCPNCSHNLRPSLPELPWFQRLQRRQDGEYAPLLAGGTNGSQQDITHHEQDVVPSLEPATVSIKRKDRKGRPSAPMSSEESAAWTS